VCLSWVTQTPAPPPHAAPDALAERRAAGPRGLRPLDAAPIAALADGFEALPDPTVLLSAEGEPLAANAAFRAVFRQAVSARRPPWGRIAPPAFVAGKRMFDAPSPDGRRWEWAETQLADGRRVASARDVSERVRAAEETTRAKTLLFATLTHELRTPLNGVIGMAGLLARSDLDPAQRDWVSAIARSGDHLLDLITDILDYSRLEAGRIELDQVVFDPEEQVQSVAELLSPKAHAKGIAIAVVVDPAIPAGVRGDDGRLRQILFNLAGNAVKFTDQGGVTFELAPGRARLDGRTALRFSIRDTGPGVAAEKQALIFEDFAQADAAITRRHGGAGLGLAIVKRLAAAMGGEVGLESQLGLGATFWAELPFDRAQGPAADPLARLDGLSVAIEGVALVLRDGLRATLTQLGARAPRAGERPDVLIAPASLAASRRAEAGGVVALAASEDRASLEAARAAGIEHYVIAPVRRRALAERVARAAGRANPTAGRGPAAPLDAREAAPRDLGLTLLLAEDNPINALLARTLLARAGCAVTVVGDGEQAVAAARKGGFDAILLDLRMPLLDGLGAARRIRALKDKSRAQVPLIAVTADASEADRAAAFAAGMDDFITKPIQPAQLETALARLSHRAKPASLG
jgi:signal transduction histidine kinase/CheY-like chemotaxis protein